MRIRPLHDNILIKRAQEEKMTPGGLFIPDAPTKQSIHGEVLAVGPGKVLNSGIRVEPSLKAGNRILLNQYGGQEIEADGEKLILIKEDQILAVLE